LKIRFILGVFWHLHVIQPVCLNGFIIEPWAITRLPLEATDHTKLCCTATSHVIAAFFELDHCPTIIASLPACFFSRFKEAIRLFILRTILPAMPFPITLTTDLRLATTAFANFLPLFFMYIARFYPFATPPSWTIYTVLG
jgi:hypothetical protein